MKTEKPNRVLRVFYVENIFTGMVENKKDRSRLEAHFKNIQRFEDFDVTEPPKMAIDSIKSRFLPLEGRIDEIAKIKPYCDAFSYKVVEINEVADKYQPKSEKVYEEPLFSGAMLMECKSVKPGSKKK